MKRKRLKCLSCHREPGSLDHSLYERGHFEEFQVKERTVIQIMRLECVFYFFVQPDFLGFDLL